MPQLATITQSKLPSLNAMQGIVRNDLVRVDQLILSRVENEVPLIGNIARHIIASGGKRIRPALTLLSAKLCKIDGNNHITRAAAIEFIHTATLLHDDVVDASKLRRGLATANDVFGNKASVLVGDFLLSQAFQLSVEDGSTEALRILANASAIISKGEVLQLATERNLNTTADEYLAVISAKTAALFAAACELGAVGTPHTAALKEFGINIGIVFQLVDDVLDYAADEKTLGKTVGDDFREGKITLPVILAYAAGSNEERSFWKSAMEETIQQPEDFKKAQMLFAKHHAAAKTITLAEKYCEAARQAISGFAPSPAKSAMLEAVDFALSRAY